MLTLQDDSTLLVNGIYAIDVSDFPRALPYDVVSKDGAIRLIPWIDAHTRRVDMILDTNSNRVSIDGWDFLGVYCRNRNKQSHFDHMIWSYGISRETPKTDTVYSDIYARTTIPPIQWRPPPD